MVDRCPHFDDADCFRASLHIDRHLGPQARGRGLACCSSGGPQLCRDTLLCVPPPGGGTAGDHFLVRVDDMPRFFPSILEAKSELAVFCNEIHESGINRAPWFNPATDGITIFAGARLSLCILARYKH